MAAIMEPRMLMVFVAIFSLTISVSAQNDRANPVHFTGGYNEHAMHKYFKQFDDARNAAKNDVESLDFGMSKDELMAVGSNPIGDIREWLMIKAREHRDNKIEIVPGPGGFADTPLGNISLTCYEDVMMMFADIDASKSYALKMYSSWGEVQEVIKMVTTGNGKSPGEYELCTGIEKGEDGAPFDVQYCGLQYSLFDVFQGYVGSCWPSSCSETELLIAHKNYRPGLLLFPFYYECLVDIPWSGGAIATMCVLSFFGLVVLIGSIYHVTIHDTVSNALQTLNPIKPKAPPKDSKMENVYEQVIEPDSKHEKPSFNGAPETGEKGIQADTDLDSDLKTITESPPVYDNAGQLPVKSEPEPGYATLTKSNGMTELMIEEEDEVNLDSVKNAQSGLRFMDRLLMSCSVFYNTEKIFSTDARSNMLGALNGMRVLSMWWVILGHSMQFPILYRYGNPYYIFGEEGISTNTAFFVILYGTFSVDTFFVLSGLLVTYLTLKELAKNNGKINWVLFYVHRYWRITPVYAAVIAIYATLGIQFGKGAAKEDFFNYTQDKCQEYWWSYLLYFNNLYPFPGNLGTESCVGWGWYLANDMQFFIISPFIIYLLYKSWKWGIGLITSMCLVSFGATAYICWYWGLPAGDSGYYNNRTVTDPSVNPDDDFIYTKPWCRISPYLVGMGLGFIFYKLNGKQVKLNLLTQMGGWAISTALACSVMYGMQGTTNGPQTPQWLAVTYNAVSRFAFSLSVAWVIFVCVTGNGGYINRFLSWSAWVPLARLSFCAFLIHPVVIFVVILRMKSLIHFTYIEISYFFIANVVASYACAFILSLLVEGPTVGLEKALLGKSKSSRNKKDN